MLIESKELVFDLWRSWRSKAIDFAMSLRCNENEWKFCISTQADKPIAIASATAALMLGFLDTIDDVADDQKTPWGEYLLGSLGDDGLCCDEADLACPTQAQPMWALQAHRTRHIAWAIELLGLKLQNHFEIVKPLCKPGGARKWLGELLSQEIPGGFWAAGNWIMDMGVLLDLEYRHFDNKMALKAIHELIDSLDDIQDEQTGYWFMPGDELRCAMAGAMHLYPMYWAHRREIKYLDRIMENTLSLQESDGLFDSEVGKGGSQCLDYDAVLILANIASKDPRWAGQVAECCTKVLNAIQVNHNADGSFSDCRLVANRFWATQAACYECNKGSLWDTYARLMTIAMCINCIYGEYPAGVVAEHHWFEIFEFGQGWNCGKSPNLNLSF